MSKQLDAVAASVEHKIQPIPSCWVRFVNFHFVVFESSARSLNWLLAGVVPEAQPLAAPRVLDGRYSAVHVECID